MYPLATLCDPYLNLFRGIIPPIGGTIDLSPILAFTVLNVFTNTAAALPCEIGEDGEPIVTERRRKWAKPGRVASRTLRQADGCEGGEGREEELTHATSANDERGDETEGNRETNARPRLSTSRTLIHRIERTD